MKKRIPLIFAGLTVTILVFAIVGISLSSQKQGASTQAEIDMAEMMGITVEELRSQTPEEHMQMMQEMVAGDDGRRGMHHHDSEEGFLPGSNVDVSTLPEAKPPEVLEVQDGDRIRIDPTMVKKTIAGKSFAMYGYNGQIPGPIIKTKQAATVTIDTTNHIDLETTIHWHGLRLDNASDGVPDVTQEAIQPDGSFTYTVFFPDEGVYWYHPHVREDIQQDMGLYGNMIVEPHQLDAYAPVNHKEVIVLDDLLLNDNGLPVPYVEDDATFPLMGRFGNHILVNGQLAEGYSLSVPQGSVVRFYVTNVANTRTLRFHFGGAKMKLVGSDVGRYEQEHWVDAVTIAPAERYIVDVHFPAAGSYAFTHESPMATYALGTVEVTTDSVDTSHLEAFETLRTNDDVIADIDAFRQHFDKPIDKTLRLSIEMHGMDHGMMQHGTDGIEWEDTMPGMNRMMTGDQVKWKLIDDSTKAENMDIDWSFTKGDVVKVRIINDEGSAHPMQHPIHFHGQRFLVLSMDGKPNENLVWKDTVLVPTGSEADLLFEMSNPGMWMFHCHIAEHLTNGMMGMFTVTE